MDIKIGIDVLQCKFKQPYHNLDDARILPCGETVCFNCINSALQARLKKSSLIITQPAITNGTGTGGGGGGLIVANTATAVQRTSLTNGNGLLTNGIKQDKKHELNPNSSSSNGETHDNVDGVASSVNGSKENGVDVVADGLLVNDIVATTTTTNGHHHGSENEHELGDSIRNQTALVVNGGGLYEASKPRDLGYFFCRFCMSYHDLESVIENKIVNSIIQQNALATNSFRTNAELLKNLLSEINEKKSQVIEFLNFKLPDIKLEISNQVDFIKENLDEIEQEMHSQLTDIKERIEQELEDMPKFGHITDFIAKTTSVSSFNEQQLIHSYTDELQRVCKKLSNSINSIRFEPNSEILQSSIIGHIVKLKQSYFKLERLQEVKSKMLITSTENEKISLDVVGLCLDWDSNILISERTEGRLMQLNMNGSILSKSNFRSEFKNSCGVCVNSKKEILVTDGKLNKIFKFNSNLKLLQIIGSYLGTRYGSLNFPWGITTDIENDDSIYVCDNGNDRILILTSNGEPKSIFTFENCQHPRKIQIIQDLVYVLHKSDNDIFVSIFDKTTQQLMNSFKQTETNIKSFYVDSSLNLITIGQLNHENFMQNLICTKKNGQLLFKTVLNIEQIIWDFCFKIVGNELQMICASNEGVFIFEF